MALDPSRAAAENEAREAGRASETFVLRVLGDLGGQPQLWLPKNPSESRNGTYWKGQDWRLSSSGKRERGALKLGAQSVSHLPRLPLPGLG